MLAGYLLARSGHWPVSVSEALTRFSYVVAMPAMLFRMMSDFSAMPPVDVRLLLAFFGGCLIARGLVPMCNTTVSNVRGPSVPMYMSGARLQVFLPVSAVIGGIGLNMTGFSYNGVLWVCFVACRRMLPDPKFFRQCLNESFAEIVSAAKKLPRTDADAEIATKPRARAAPKKAARAGKKAAPAAPRKAAVPLKAAAPRKVATPVKRRKKPAVSA